MILLLPTNKATIKSHIQQAVMHNSTVQQKTKNYLYQLNITQISTGAELLYTSEQGLSQRKTI